MKEQYLYKSPGIYLYIALLPSAIYKKIRSIYNQQLKQIIHVLLNVRIDFVVFLFTAILF